MEQSYELSKDTMSFEYAGFDNKISTLKYKICSSNVNTSDRNSEMEGFSGAGIFCDLDSELVLVGIHKGAAGSNAERGEFVRNNIGFY